MKKFKARDEVLIVGRVLNEMGWENLWNHRMDDFVGDERKYTIKYVDERGCFFEGNVANQFGWPHGALRKAEYDLFDTYEEAQGKWDQTTRKREQRP